MTLRLAVIPDFPDYAARSDGEIVRIRVGLNGIKPTGTPLAKVLNSSGTYFEVSVCKNARAFSRRVNRLVCSAFHGAPDRKSLHARHLNGDSFDNRPENLRWGTATDNEGDKVAHGTRATGDRHWSRIKPHRRARGEGHGLAKLNDQKAKSIYSDTRSISQIAAEYGVSYKSVTNIKGRITWRHVTGD